MKACSFLNVNATPFNAPNATANGINIFSSSITLLWHHIAHRICSIWRNRLICNPYVDQGLHGSRVLVREKSVKLCNGAEVYKARIEIGPSLSVGSGDDVPERIHPMRMVQMGVDPEDLAETCPNIVQKRLREASALSKPVTACQAGKRSIDRCWPSGDKGLGRRAIDATGGVRR